MRIMAEGSCSIDIAAIAAIRTGRSRKWIMGR